ncbi:DNA-directed RNA polymerase subunit beta' [Candidatus Gottesmanbacteria bacterium RIFCSPHIGHO2_01_FULL_47_48]|uniref:DNA-directed RNA polymerase subunit beta' n=1 Tax=Candidatus Gottesmanbacteria bacterium RIFCSPHIGHO2_01_FULL_47_48 TaxID=1798381 RepID=A0A1F6A0F0_9BACT|nr:MAG: DNA-directed RNA polymerase subunit beta' [Candidatus Gottesmanbacteria bacterium RIFCSPHIGHO2_01_FULL_47_48]
MNKPSDNLTNLVDFKGLKIILASPSDILSWSHGEVTKPETINYRTLKPEKDGLFSENIFGPTKDWECYCGKYKRIRYRGIICDKCGVEVTQSKVRRERMGHISLAVPVAHVWYFKGAPSKLSLLLDITPKALENVIYFASYLVLSVDQSQRDSVISDLKKTMEERQKSLQKDYENRIATEKDDSLEKIKAQKERVKEDKARQELVVAEIELSTKQKIAKLEDEFNLEKNRLAEIYHTLSDLVKSVRPLSQLTEEEYLKLDEYGAANFITVGMGAEAILDVLKTLDLEKMAADLRAELEQASGQKRIKVVKQLRVADGMSKANVRPEWMILEVLPVIPPDLRPMVQLSGGRFATSDLNDLYRRVINRNNRLKHLIDLGAPEIILRNEKRMLQEAVDSLIDASQRTSHSTRANAIELKSLSDILRGKQGRFRQNLLGKRVDYSGRSVIVVGPHLKISECGLPKEMALEMFKPFVLRELIIRGLAPNVRSAKYILERRTPEVFDILEEITKNHPVLLNRAPTLHKLGIQAFYPILIEGSAIQVHPLVCDGFNADFDGDQMAVHVPLSQNSRAEAANLMLAEHNLLKPADGMPVTAPRKEIILGIYIYTSIDEKIPQANTIFSDFSEATLAWQEHKIALRQKIKVRHDKTIMETTVGRVLVNEFLPKELGFINETLTAKKVRALVSQAMDMISSDEVVKLLDNLKQTGFAAATSPGISLGIFDLPIPSDMGGTIAEGDAEIAEVDSNYQAGLITAGERDKLQIEIWLKITDKISDLTWDMYSKDNPARLIVEAGAGRVNRDTMKQISGMRGLMNDPTGKIVPMPIKSNFRQGFNVFEYIIGTRGSRKGLADTALRTADAGYLTRRLVDVSHDAIIRLVDCATTEGIEISADDKRGAYTSRLLGRILAAEVKSGKRVLGSAGEEIDERLLAEIEKEKITSVFVRSPLRCQAKYGLCQKCYGRDFSTRKFVELGTPVGIIAAQSIGEPGTQLTLRTKHSGGVVAQDVTQGLPRVEELFETRSPKVLSPIAEIAGKVEITETPEGYKLRIRSVGVKPVEEREYIIPLTAQLKVADGDLVTAGVQLSSGALDIKDVLAVRGLAGTQRYLIDELQAVYESQGIPINDKHFEVIVRKMSDKVRLESSGDTIFLPGEFIDRPHFDAENARVIAAGGEPAVAQVTILGVSRAALYTGSWLSAASFERTTEVLTDAAIRAAEDPLTGLKENVIIGRLIPTSAERARLENVQPSLPN